MHYKCTLIAFSNLWYWSSFKSRIGIISYCYDFYQSIQSITNHYSRTDNHDTIYLIVWQMGEMQANCNSLKIKCISLVLGNGRKIIVIIVILYPTTLCLWIQLLPTNKNNKDNGYISAECNVIIQIYIKNKEMFCFVTLCWKRRRGIFHINQRKWYFLSKCGTNNDINSCLYICSE